jgi:tRNA nucleotidyltransferase (CCA-adding enzyme)
MMKNYLDTLPAEARDLISIAGDIARQMQVEAYLIGGCVRDMLLGVKNLDLDIAIGGDGIRFAQSLAGQLNAKLVVHKRFGTASLTVKPHLKVDIASTRKESYPSPASLPVVEQGRIEDDLLRRDFTINAMAVTINATQPGGLKDVFKGQEDLRGKKIRILHALSFIDDPTRILRAVRFEQRYGFRIEPFTLRHLKEAVGRGMLDKVEPQRLRDEMILLLKEPCPARYIKRLAQLKAIGFIHSRLAVTAKTRRLFSAIDKELQWFLREHHHRRHLDVWLMYFMALIEPLDNRMVRQVCRKFAFRKGEEKRILCWRQLSDTVIRQLQKEHRYPSKVFRVLEHLSYEVIILLKARLRDKNTQRNIAHFLAIHDGVKVSISGHDLRCLGIAPGPCYQEIFYKILNAKIDGRVKTREEELAFADAYAKKGVYHVKTGKGARGNKKGSQPRHTR